MAANEQEKPLAPEISSTPRRSRRVAAAAEDEAITAVISSPHRRRRKCVICCGCAVSTLVILSIVIVILALTVFKVKNPTLSISDVTLRGLAVNSTGLLRTDVNVTLGAHVAIKNPNAASLRFGDSTTAIFYGGVAVGEARIPASNARARRTLQVNVTVDVMTEKLAEAPGLVGDLAAGTLEVGSYTVVRGRVKVLGIVKKHVKVGVNCTILVDIRKEDAQIQHCSRHVSL